MRATPGPREPNPKRPELEWQARAEELRREKAELFRASRGRKEARKVW